MRTGIELPTVNGTMGEDATKQLLSRVGLQIPRHGIARSVEEAGQIAASIDGPLVLKLELPELTHKTEVGGVRVNVPPSAVGSTYEDLAAIGVACGFHSSDISVRIESHVESVAECAVGLVRVDPLGHLAMVGMGGTHLEATADVTFRLAPVTVDEAREMISSLKAAALLDGWRGGPAADVDALAEVVSQVSRLSVDLGERLQELDINPVAVLPAGQGAVVLDALMVLDDEREGQTDAEL